MIGEGVSPMCPETLEIGDDYGDNVATMHCQLEEGHEGRHQETFFDGHAIIQWDTERRSEP
jgi:hypothetical protein